MGVQSTPEEPPQSGAALPWVDWDTTLRVATSSAPIGPPVSLAERRQAVEQLRASAERAPQIVADASHLQPPARGEALIVDRAGFARANTDMMRQIWQGIGVEVRPRGPGLIPGIVRGGAVGKMIGLLSGHVLGQFNPLGSPPRLLLVAPSIMSTERRLGVDPGDFRLWVALHEQTHRAQFQAAGWLTAWMLGRVRALIEADADHESAVHGALDHFAMLKHHRDSDDDVALTMAEMLTTPSAAAVLEQVSGVMSLLEGHADVMMDRAGPEVIASLATIRARFDARRGRGGPQMIMLRALGMGAKLAQYREGAAFCHAVIDAADNDDEGIELLTRVFTSAAEMPSLHEIRQPDAWLARMGVDVHR